MQELLSGLTYIIEVIVYYTNPHPITILEFGTTITLVKVSLGFLGGSLLYASFKKNPRLFGPLGAACVAAVIAINFTVRLTEEMAILLSLHYLNFTKVIDGLFFGMGLYRLIRYHKKEMVLISIFLLSFALLCVLFEPLRNKIIDFLYGLDFEQISFRTYTILVIAISAFGILGIHRRVPMLKESFLLTISIIAVSSSGVLIMPSLEDAGLNILFLLLFPVSVLLGFQGGRNMYKQQNI